jgi:hypothetical protein
MLASVPATITTSEPTISPCPHASSTSPLGSVGRDEYALSGILARDRQSDQFEDHDQLVSGYECVATNFSLRNKAKSGQNLDELPPKLTIPIEITRKILETF